MQSNIWKVLFWSPPLIYLACLTQNAFYLSQSNPTAWSLGFGLLVFGWMGDISWFANPILFLSWGCIARKKYKMAQVSSLIALLFGLSFLTTKSLLTSTQPSYAMIESYGIGYWLWLMSMGITLIVAIIYHFGILKVDWFDETVDQ